MKGAAGYAFTLCVTDLTIMSSDASPLAGPPGADALAKVTSQWDDLPPLPKSVDGSHLAPCPNCGVENGALAQTCWNCEGSLIPAAPLRLVTKDGADVSRQAANAEAAPVAAMTGAMAPPGGDTTQPTQPTQTPAAPVDPAPSDAEDFLAGWMPALDLGDSSEPSESPLPPEPRAYGLNLQVIGAVFAVAVLAGAGVYYKAHFAEPGLGDFGGRPNAGAGAWGGSAQGSPTARPGGGASTDAVTQSVDDALAAAERALSTPPGPDAAASAALPVSADPRRSRVGNGADAAATGQGKTGRKRRDASEDSAPAGPSASVDVPSRPTRSGGPATGSGRSCSPTLAALGLCQAPSP